MQPLRCPRWTTVPFFLFLFLAFGACQKPGGAPPANTGAVAGTSVAAGTDCVETYDPAVDYFPDKAEPRFAERFAVEYFPHYKHVTVTLLDGETSLEYFLYQCGTPPPEVPADAKLIEIPVRTVVTTSTTELPHILELDLLDRLVGHDEFDYISSPEVRRKIEDGNLTEVGSETRLNFEVLVNLAPELVLATNLASFDKEVFLQAQASGIRVVHIPSYLEKLPLGQAEWIVFTSLFFNREARASEIFGRIAQSYAEWAQRVAAVTERPTVFAGAPIGDTWHVPGGESFMARLVGDAGGHYLWGDLPTAGGVPLAIESVYERAVSAGFWLHPGLWGSLEQIAGVDERFATLEAFTGRRVYSNDARINDVGEHGVGGNDYWETGTQRPDLVLADLISILHPELAADHELMFHRRL